MYTYRKHNNELQYVYMYCEPQDNWVHIHNYVRLHTAYAMGPKVIIILLEAYNTYIAEYNITGGHRSISERLIRTAVHCAPRSVILSGQFFREYDRVRVSLLAAALCLSERELARTTTLQLASTIIL